MTTTVQILDSVKKRDGFRVSRSRSACVSMHEAQIFLRATHFRRTSEVIARKLEQRSLSTTLRHALTRYVEDGRLALSNNAAERALRRFALGRKNWQFFQREGGGRTAAILMSLLMTAKAAGVEPRDYFRDVLLRLSTCTDIAQLTPAGWREQFAAEVAERRHGQHCDSHLPSARKSPADCWQASRAGVSLVDTPPLRQPVLHLLRDRSSHARHPAA